MRSKLKSTPLINLNITRNKIILIIVLVIVLALISVGIYFIVKFVDDKKKKKNTVSNGGSSTDSTAGSSTSNLPNYNDPTRRNFNVSNTQITGYWLSIPDPSDQNKLVIGTTNPSNMQDIGILYTNTYPIECFKNGLPSKYKQILTSAKEKFISFGNFTKDNTSPKWSVNDLDFIMRDRIFNLTVIKKEGWDGVCFVINQCDDTDGSFVPLFAKCFERCKFVGLKVLVSFISASPIGCKTSSEYYELFKNNKNIDYISPGYIVKLDGWNATYYFPAIEMNYSNSYAKIIPSIPFDYDAKNMEGTLFDGYLTYFRNK